jgi:hypothetical protein
MIVRVAAPARRRFAVAPKQFRLDRRIILGMGVLALLGLQSAAAGAARDSGWKLAKRGNEPGNRFELYYREVAGSGYDRYRLEAVVDEPIERVIQAIQIRNIDDQYLDKGLTRSFVHRADGDDSLTYFKMQLPFIKDRDVTLRTKRGFDEEFRVYRDEWWTANEEAPPLRKGFVRMVESVGFWEATPAGDNRTYVVYESHADPGGRVPSWIANSILGDQVISQMVTLRRILDDRHTDVASPPPLR